MPISETSVAGSLPASCSCRQVFESKWMDVALIAVMIASTIIVCLAVTGHFDFIGTTGVNCIRYGAAAIGAAAGIAEIKKLCIHWRKMHEKSARFCDHINKRIALLEQWKSVCNAGLMKMESNSQQLSDPLSDAEMKTLKSKAIEYAEEQFKALWPNPYASKEKQAEEKQEFIEKILPLARDHVEIFLLHPFQEDPLAYIDECSKHNVDADLLHFFKNTLKEMRPAL